MSELAAPLPEPDPEDLVRELGREEATITRDLLDAELQRSSIRERIRLELRSRLQPFVTVEDGHAGGRRHDDRRDPDVVPGRAVETHEERVAYVLARPEAGVRQLARQLGVAPSTVTRIRKKYETPKAIPLETPIVAAVAQSEALLAAAATDELVDADAPPSAVEQITAHQRGLSGPDAILKGLLVPQPRLHYIPLPSEGDADPVNIGTYDLSRTRIEIGPLPHGPRRRKPPSSPFTPYAPNNA